MTQAKDNSKKSAAESFCDMFEAFGSAIGQVFDDPELKVKAKEFGKSAVKSAETFGNRFKDEDVKDKFGDVAKAAQDFSKSMAELFSEGKAKRDVGNEKEEE